MEIKTLNAAARIMEGQKLICRTCMGVIQNNTFTYIDDENNYIVNVGRIRDMIQFCVPELDLYVSKDPVICHQCLPQLVTVYNFKNKCMNIESSIRNYLRRNNLQDYNHVNLSCVVDEEARIKNQLVFSQQNSMLVQNPAAAFKAETVSDKIEAGLENVSEIETFEESKIEVKEEAMSEDDDDNSSTDQEFVEESTDVKKEPLDTAIELPNLLDLPKMNKLKTPRIILRINKKNLKVSSPNPPANSDAQKVSLSSPIAINSIIDKLQMGFLQTNGVVVNTAMANALIPQQKPESSISLVPQDLLKETSQEKQENQNSPKPVILNSLVKLPSKPPVTVPNTFPVAEIKKEAALQGNTQTEQTDYKCRFCPFSCYRPGLLARHLNLVHTVSEWFFCEFCFFSTDHYESLQVHRKKNHVSFKDGFYLCPMCPYKSSSVLLVVRHIEARHDKKNEMKCEFCPYRTKDKSNFRKHVFTHGTKPLHCDSCEYKCVSPYQMRRHIKRNHQEKDLDNYKVTVEHVDNIMKELSYRLKKCESTV